MNSTIGAAAPQLIASPDEEEQLALVERIVASTHFRRSARLRDFLHYVVTQHLRDPQAELNEQEIGEKVFGRPADYNRSQDNIVRVNATELRRRIEMYFAEEGTAETLLLEIPRGGYKPVFSRRVLGPQVAPAAPVEAPALVREPAVIEEHPSSRWLRFVWPAATLLLAVLCGVLWWQNRSLRQFAAPASATPALSAFWSSFAPNHQQTDIVLPDDSASVIEDITHESISLQDYLNREYMRQIQSSSLSADRKMDLDQIFSHNLITFGGVRAAQLVLTELPAVPPPHLTLSRFYTADAMKRNNVILVGGRKANPWVHLFDDRLNFVVGFDHAEGHAFISNQHARPGEQATYIAPLNPNAFTGYGVVAYLPNPSQDGHAIILAGMDSDSTSAAAEFLTSEEQMARFQKLLKVKEFPYFEVLLRISRVSGTSFSGEIVAYRTYPKNN